MSKLITTKFRTHSAAQFIESFSETSNSIYYIGAHRSIPFDDDASPPDPDNTVQGTHYKLFDDLVFGKHINPEDVRHMIRNITWTSGTIYDMYDDITVDLESKNFYVVSLESTNYHIFKCLDNYNGSPSTSQPLFSETSADDEVYRTNDGYQWKYMYSISQSNYSKFATAQYVPVFPNANVTGNAVSGSIDTILITNPGSQYNSYASGTIKESAVSGNSLLYTLSSDKFAEYDVTLVSVDGFVEEKVTSTFNSKTSNGVIVAVFAGNNTVRVTNVNRSFYVGANNTLKGVTTGANSIIVSSTPLSTALSTSAGFYKNNSFYIRAGKGAGQLRNIDEYIVTGDTRRVLLNGPFDIVPDTTSIFEIGPRVIITGDGINAKAVAIVNPSANSIADIEIIDSGSNYTYANITIIANTGNISNTSSYINTSSAKARAVISPEGGHGYDVVNELFATRVGIGVSFANTEGGTVPATNDYRKISIIKDPLISNVELTLTTSDAALFGAGEYVVQANTGATGQITNRDGDVLRLTNITGFFEASGNTSTYIRGLTSNSTAVVASKDRDFYRFDQRQKFQLNVVNNGLNNAGFSQDELVIQTGLSLISSDIVRLTANVSAFLFDDGDTVTQYANSANLSLATANGTIIDRYNNTIVVNPNYGTFLTGNSTVNVIKLTPNTTTVFATVNAVDNTFQANGLGYIHSLNGNTTNSTVIGLTNVQGVFNLSDAPSGTINTFIGQTNGAVANLTGKDYTSTSLVDGSGEILYVENFSPIVRSTTQTEKIKLIIEF